MSETINPNARVINEGSVYIEYITEYGTAPNRYNLAVPGNSGNVTFTITADALPELSYDGITFCGWYLTNTFDDDSLVTVHTSITAEANSTITLYAKWLKPVKTYMTNIANPIRNLLNTTNTLTIDNMNTNLDTTIAAVSDIKAALTEKGIDASGANTIGDVGALVSGIAGKYPNGTSWTQSNSVTNLQPNYCAYANGVWVACGYDTGLYYSTNGKTWIQSNITSGNFINCINANGMWVTCSSTSSYYSADGKNWTSSNLVGKECQWCTYANGLWIVCVATYGFYYSTDGMSWTRTGPYDHIYYCDYANGIWVAGSNGSKGLYYSVDGKTWTRSNIASGNFAYCVNANGIWVACEGTGSGLYYSTDGKNWTQSNITNINCYHCIYANGIWVACTKTGLYYSIDGMTWTQSNITYSFYWCANANGIWVACSNSTKGIYYSIDGKTWVASNIKSGAFYHCTNANGIWVTSGENDLYYSVTWEP